MAAHFASPAATQHLALVSERARRRARAGQGWGGDDGRRDVPHDVRARSHHGGGDWGETHGGRFQGGAKGERAGERGYGQQRLGESAAGDPAEAAQIAEAQALKEALKEQPLVFDAKGHLNETFNDHSSSPSATTAKPRRCARGRRRRRRRRPRRRRRRNG